MSAIDVVNLVAGVVELVVAALLVRESTNLGLGRPAIVWTLSVFFAVDALVAINRSEAFWTRTGNLVYATTLDLLALVVLAVVMVNARRLGRAAVATVDIARYRAAEYERARRDYTQVVRHRIMNPLAVVEGAARTLDAETSLDEATRRELLRAIIESAAVLKNVTLEPEQRDSLERDLNAKPRF